MARNSPAEPGLVTVIAWALLGWPRGRRELRRRAGVWLGR